MSSDRVELLGLAAPSGVRSNEGLDIFAHETDIDFSVNVLPFLCCPQLGKQRIELSLMDWRELEPIKKIERFIF